MVKTADEFLEIIKTRIGDSTTDEDLQFIEDATDTIMNLSGSESRVAELEAENEELRKKYRDRFFEAHEERGEEHNEEVKTTFESLFEEVEK